MTVRRRRGGFKDALSSEDGGGTVLAAALAFALLLILFAIVALGQAAMAAGKAATAADLAALAAADAARGLSVGEPCSVAADLTRLQGAVLLSCVVGGVARDTVQIEVSLASGLPWPAHGMARAGPPPG